MLIIQSFQLLRPPRGQGGIEIWLDKDWLEGVPKPIVLHASPRVLIVSLTSNIGLLHIVAAHALDYSYPFREVKQWWDEFDKINAGASIPSAVTLWLVDANATVGSVCSQSI